MSVFLKGRKGTITITTIAKIDGDCGKTETRKFKTTWRKATVSEIRSLVAALDPESDHPLDEDAEIKGRLIGWSDLKNDAGEEVPFSDDELDALLNDREYRPALAEAYKAAMFGIKAVEQKN